MAGVRGPRPQVGSAAWVGEERSSALQIVEQEIEEFSYSARNELEWINEHMAGILNENELNLAETFKSPGKFRTRTPHTTRKQIVPESRTPLSDVFASTSNGPKPQPPAHTSTTPRFQPPQIHALTRPTPMNVRPTSPRREPLFSPSKSAPSLALPVQNPVTHGSQAPESQEQRKAQGTPKPETTNRHLPSISTPLRLSPAKQLARESPAKAIEGAAEGGLQVSANEEPEQRAEEEVETDHHESYTPADSPTAAPQARDDANLDEERSSSEASSPVRPLGRKSSLNLASLPAREPRAGGKSLGGGLSRTGPAEGNKGRTSYYQRVTGGKSLGATARGDLQITDHNPLDVDKVPAADAPATERQPLTHSKTYTQRLQDQISLLGKAQVKAALTVTPIIPPPVTTEEPSTTPDSPPANAVPTTPGPFADDDDEDWIDPPKTLDEALESAPPLSRSFTAEIMEGIHEKNAVGQTESHMASNELGQLVSSPQKVASVGRGFQNFLGHNKTPSLATTSANSVMSGDSHGLVQPLSNPDAAPPVDHASDTPSKSPVRTTRESPLKHVKNKLSSILKSSRGLLASGGAASTEGKTMLSPSASRLALHLGPSSESVAPRPLFEVPEGDTQSMEEPASPAKPIARRTRASTEREKEEKRREREAKYMADQNDKLDKAREEQREKARVFGREQEQIAAMEKKLASKSHQERILAKEGPHLTRGSPEKTRAMEEADIRQFEADVEMTDEGSGPSTKSGGSGPVPHFKDSKRPVKPNKEAISKVKQAPTVIRVNTGSQTSQLGSRVSTASHEITGPSGSQAPPKVTKPTLQSKASSQNLKALPAAVRPKVLDMTMKKKEQEEREAQRRREAKAEIERKRAVIQEEQRKHAERQRQVAAEKARQSRAPMSAMRSQANGPSDGGAYGQQRGEPSRPPSRMTSGVPVSSSLSSAVKTGAKRALVPDVGEDGPAKRPQSRGGPTYQAKDGKRRRTSEVAHEPEMGPARNIKGPPVRPSNGFKKDMPPKTVFSNGYTNAPPHSATRDLFKATVTAQHNSQVKGSHPLDLAQISKGPIPFAGNAGASSSTHKTPARIPSFAAGKSTAKKATRSSPRLQNGESIELPEIQTDDEDEDDDAQAMMVAAWADSPDLRRALIRQETVDPSQIFGPPAPLNMEEVFNKSKDKWHKFRQRTSSANWNGLDRLTEEDIRKDMAAREKLRRDGGWSYEMSKNL